MFLKPSVSASTNVATTYHGFPYPAITKIILAMLLTSQ